MHIKDILIECFTATTPEYSIALVMTLSLIAVIFGLVYRFKPRWKYLAYAVLTVFLVRIVLFGQYLSWEFYKDHLSVDDLGWRQQGMLPAEYNKFFKNSHEIKYLAVGSSQTFAVYSDYSNKHNNLTVFNLAGMTPLEYYLYRDYIAAKDAEYILLYVSEFDLAKDPNLNSAKNGPPQGVALLEILPTLSRIANDTVSENALKEMVAGKFFPEYKYSFIFKGFLNKLTKKNEALRVQSLYEQFSPDEAQMEENAKDLTGEMDARWIKYNDYFLRKFLVFCAERSFKVIIVEGQYNPVAYTEKAAVLNRAAREELETIAGEFEHVRFFLVRKLWRLHPMTIGT